MAPPDGERYRTRMAEAIRLFSRLRQLFPNRRPDAWRNAPNLVADYRLLLHPRRFPRRDQTPEQVLSSLQRDGGLSPLAQDVVRALVRAGDDAPGGWLTFRLRPHGESCARWRAAAQRYDRLRRNREWKDPRVLRAGAGGDRPSGRRTQWTKAIALYPRNELLKDQLREALSNARRAAAALERHEVRRITLGALFNKVPRNAADASRALAEDGAARADGARGVPTCAALCAPPVR